MKRPILRSCHRARGGRDGGRAGRLLRDSDACAMCTEMLQQARQKGGAGSSCSLNEHPRRWAP